MVTAAEADIIVEENKIIFEALSWHSPDRRGRTHKLSARVLSLDSGESLKLDGYVGRKNRSFTLLYQNVPIRKFTVHNDQPHTDPVTCKVFTQPHKHFWDDDWEDGRAYIPNDIRLGNINEELMDFLTECNIELRGAYRDLTI